MSDYPYDDPTWIPAKGDLAQVWWGGLPGDDEGVWEIWADWEGPRGFVRLTRPNVVSGVLNIDRKCVRLVEPVEERLARTLMEKRR